MSTEQEHRKISSFSVILVFIAMMIIGLAMIPGLQFQLSPSRTSKAVSVNFNWRGTSARIVEMDATSKLESLFSTMKGLEEISSTSSTGYGRINLTFNKEADIDAVRFELATLIRRAYPSLPEEVSYPLISIGASGKRKSAILTYMLTSPADPYFIKQYAEENIQPKLARIEGISEISIYGESPFRFEIVFDNEKARLLNISSQDIRSAVNTYFNSEELGIFPSGENVSGKENEFSVYIETERKEDLKWESIPVKMSGNRMVHLTDIASVVYRERPPQNYHRINGLNTVNIVIYPADGTNNIEVANRVKALVKEMNQELPAGNSMLLSYDATDFLVKELRKIAWRSLMSLLILLIFVWVISRKVRYLLYITFSMLATLIIAAIFYKLLNLEIHLYSLAGITVSFGIIIDNSIVMIDHYRYRKNKRVFIAILAATLTTIGALSIVFFLKEGQKLNLADFTAVTIINLAVSLLIALFFIPSLIDRFPLRTKKSKRFFRQKRNTIRINTFYIGMLRFVKRWKWIFIVGVILGFGIPSHLLPDKIDKESAFATVYNKTIGAGGFSRVKSTIDKIIGGSFRLFTENTFRRSFYSDPERTRLYIRGSMPEGSTVQQLNEVIRRMENYLSGFEEISMFQTRINSYDNSSIEIHFKQEHEFGSFPSILKQDLTAKAISLGGLDWSIYGVGRGFNNAVYSDSKDHHIELTGFNYEQLYRYAEILQDSLVAHPRVRDTEIAGEMSWRSRAVNEFHVKINEEELALRDLQLYHYFSSLSDNALYSNISPVYSEGKRYPVTLVSKNQGSFKRWDLVNNPAGVGNVIVKLGDIGRIEKVRTGKSINKKDQEYLLYINFNFIGSGILSRKVVNEVVDNMNESLPMGYKVRNAGYGGYWNRDDKAQYYLLFVVVLIIYFICAILLESLIQPLAIIAMIPISFIGVFLTYVIFNINFDQGGFAAFVLLCGLSVNSALYIINDYNIFRKERGTKKRLRAYMKAYNHKIVPALLTILSTSIGLIPFLVHSHTDVFWFSFAAGTIGGLIFSLIALYVYFPLILNVVKIDKSNSQRRSRRKHRNRSIEE